MAHRSLPQPGSPDLSRMAEHFLTTLNTAFAPAPPSLAAVAESPGATVHPAWPAHSGNTWAEAQALCATANHLRKLINQLDEGSDLDPGVARDLVDAILRKYDTALAELLARQEDRR